MSKQLTDCGSGSCPDLSISDGTRTLESTATFNFSVNGDQFYLTTDSDGDPLINLVDGTGGGGPDTNTVTITDGVHDLTSDDAIFSVNENHFYLDTDSNGDPKINLKKDRFNRSYTGHFISAPQETITLDEFVALDATIEYFAGKTSSGTGKITIKINEIDVAGLVNLEMGTIQFVNIATGDNVVEYGNRITMHMNDFYASNFAWTLGVIE